MTNESQMNEKQIQNSDEFWFDYKLDWENPKGIRQPKASKNKREEIEALKKLENYNKSTKDEDGKVREEKLFPSYRSYIKSDKTIAIQEPLTTNPEERIFILVHQMYELAFKQIIFDLSVINKTLVEVLKNKDESLKDFIQCPIPVNYEQFNNASALSQLLLKVDVQTEEEKHSLTEFRKQLFWQSAYFASNRLIVNAEKVLSSLSCMLDINSFNGIQFSQFRPALLPASGFQGEQFRTIQMILGRYQCLSSPFFGIQEFLKKYNVDSTYSDDTKWEKMYEIEIDQAIKQFHSIASKYIYQRFTTEELNLDWLQNQNDKGLTVKENGTIESELCINVNDLLVQFHKLYCNEKTKLKDIYNNNPNVLKLKFESFEIAIEKFLNKAGYIQDKDAVTTADKNKLELIRNKLKESIKLKFKHDFDNHWDNVFHDNKRLGMQEFTKKNRNTFLFQILKNLSRFDAVIHGIDYSKHNRNKSHRESIIDRPYFSFLERHFDFIVNQIGIVMEFEGGSAISGSGGGGENYFEFAMRLYDMFPPFPAVDEYVLK